MEVNSYRIGMMMAKLKVGRRLVIDLEQMCGGNIFLSLY
jgi:hypothetical protein